MGSGDVLLGLCVLQRRLHSRQGSATHEGEAEHIVFRKCLASDTGGGKPEVADASA